MSRPLIVIGDRTDHGGHVIQGSSVSTTGGNGISRVGDRVLCPMKGHGITVIVTGDPTMIIDGSAAARHGDKCGCGATLLSSQFVTTADEGAGTGAIPEHYANLQSGSACGSFTGLHAEVHAYDIHFAVRDQDTGQVLANISYKLSLEDGTFVTGRTDSNGLTERLGSKTKQRAILEVHYHGDYCDSGADTSLGHNTCHC